MQIVHSTGETGFLLRDNPIGANAISDSMARGATIRDSIARLATNLARFTTK